MEGAVAVVVLAGLALFAPDGHAGSVALKSGAVSRWTSGALPVLANLTKDSSAIEKDSGPASIVPTGPRRDDAARYKVDLAAAQRLPAPPDAGLARAWRSTLAQLTTASFDLQMTSSVNAEALARAHVRFAAIEMVLLEFQQAIRPAH